MTKTTIPIPPSQCVKERQNRSDLGMASISVRIEAPVVLKPEQDSKKASAAEGIAPDSQKGSAPMTEQSSQLTDTTRKPSRTFIFA